MVHVYVHVYVRTTMVHIIALKNDLKYKHSGATGQLASYAIASGRTNGTGTVGLVRTDAVYHGPQVACKYVPYHTGNGIMVLIKW